MAAWAFECLLCKASQKSYLAPGKLGESEWVGRLAGSRTIGLTLGSRQLSDPSANSFWAWSGKEGFHRPLCAMGHWPAIVAAFYSPSHKSAQLMMSLNGTCPWPRHLGSSF